MKIHTVRWAAPLVAFCLVAPVLAQDAKPAQPQRLTKADAEKAIKEQDAKRIEAMVKADLTTLETILAKDLTYTHSNGKVDTKESLLEALKTGAMKYVSVAFTDPKYQVYGNTVITTGVAEVKVQNGANEVAFKARFIEVWTRQRNEWRFAAWQTTRLPEEKK